MASPIELMVQVKSDASGVATDFDKVSRSAKDMGAAVDAAGRDADSAVSKLDRAASGAENMDDKFGKATGAMGALSAGLSVAGLDKYAGAMDTAAMATDGLSGIGQSLSLVMELQSVQTLKAYAATVLSTAASYAAAAATQVYAGAQWLLNAALNANPIGLLVVALVALVAVFVLLYNKSETFRNLVDGLWSGIQDGAKAAADLVEKVFTKAWDLLKDAIGWNPVVLLARNWDKVTDTIKEPFITAKDWVVDLFSAEGPIAGALDKGVTFLGNVWDAVTGVIKDPFITAKDWVVDLFSRDGAIAGALDTGLTVLGNVWDALLGVLKAPFNLLEDWLVSFFGEEGPIAGIMDTLKGIVSGALRLVIDAINAVIKVFNKLPGPNLSYLANPLAASRGVGGVTAVAGGTAAVTTTGGAVAPGSTVVNITVNGAIDPYQTGRQIERALARSGLVTGRVTA